MDAIRLFDFFFLLISFPFFGMSVIVFLFLFLAPGLSRFSCSSFTYRTHFCSCYDDVITDTMNESEANFERVFRHTFCPSSQRRIKQYQTLPT